MRRRDFMTVALLLAARPASLFAWDGTPEWPRPGDIPRTIPGRDIRNIPGWFANIYPWAYEPAQSTVHPVSWLWTPGQRQSWFENREQGVLLQDYGSGADVLEYNPNPDYADHNHWLRTYFGNEALANRPFFLLYEHVFGTRFAEGNRGNGDHDMDDPENRRVFLEDVEWMVREVMMRWPSRYVTLEGKGVIFLWSVCQMKGDFASLLRQARARYPVKFLGSINMLALPDYPERVPAFEALDGFMEYALFPFWLAKGGRVEYERMAQAYEEASERVRRMIGAFQAKTGKPYLFVPTFQLAFDDSRVVPARRNPVMYAKDRNQVLTCGQKIRNRMGTTLYDDVGPFVVAGELFEGGAVIESQCRLDALDVPGHFVGCGTGRLELVAEVFKRN